LTFSKASGRITSPAAKFSETLALEGPGKLKVDSELFSRCRNVDGIRLQGEWTSYGNPNDPCNPNDILFFGRGRFNKRK
jgi:hypothetical protein